MIEWRKVTEGRSRKLSAVPEGATILSVNGRDCIAMCELCGKPILDGQGYEVDGEGDIYVHDRCPKKGGNQ